MNEAEKIAAANQEMDNILGWRHLICFRIRTKWVARKAQIKQETAYATVTRAVGSGDLPNAAISDDYSTLYLDDALMPTAGKPAAAPQAEPAQPLTDAEQFRREGMDFLNYLKVCRGKLGTDADEELAAMQKTCASIMGFVHNHPEQLNRVRRFREYNLPTTRCFN